MSLGYTVHKFDRIYSEGNGVNFAVNLSKYSPQSLREHRVNIYFPFSADPSTTFQSYGAGTPRECGMTDLVLVTLSASGK